MLFLLEIIEGVAGLHKTVVTVLYSVYYVILNTPCISIN